MWARHGVLAHQQCISRWGWKCRAHCIWYWVGSAIGWFEDSAFHSIDSLQFTVWNSTNWFRNQVCFRRVSESFGAYVKCLLHVVVLVYCWTLFKDQTNLVLSPYFLVMHLSYQTASLVTNCHLFLSRNFFLNIFSLTHPYYVVTYVCVCKKHRAVFWCENQTWMNHLPVSSPVQFLIKSVSSGNRVAFVSVHKVNISCEDFLSQSGQAYMATSFCH